MPTSTMGERLNRMKTLRKVTIDIDQIDRTIEHSKMNS